MSAIASLSLSLLAGSSANLRPVPYTPVYSVYPSQISASFLSTTTVTATGSYPSSPLTSASQQPQQPPDLCIHPPNTWSTLPGPESVTTTTVRQHVTIETTTIVVTQTVEPPAFPSSEAASSSTILSEPTSRRCMSPPTTTVFVTVPAETVCSASVPSLAPVPPTSEISSSTQISSAVSSVISSSIWSPQPAPSSSSSYTPSSPPSTPSSSPSAAPELFPFTVTNHCPEPIWPAVLTQFGKVAPGSAFSSGFRLEPNTNRTIWVSASWQGRIWARENCTFPAEQTEEARDPSVPSTNIKPLPGPPVCLTGDCAGQLECTVSGAVPATLAEFTLSAEDGRTYYDISLVDGYSLPVAVISQASEKVRSQSDGTPALFPNMTSPVCIGTADFLAPADFDSQSSRVKASSNDGDGLENITFLGTPDNFPLALERSVSHSFVESWCPSNLVMRPPDSDGKDKTHGYSGPNPPAQSSLDSSSCISACARFNKPEDCCTGEYGTPATCGPSEYSIRAKRVCPDAYSYAYDDLLSTFIVDAQSVGGFEVRFCPRGRSTNILRSVVGAAVSDIASRWDEQKRSVAGTEPESITSATSLKVSRMAQPDQLDGRQIEALVSRMEADIFGTNLRPDTGLARVDRVDRLRRALDPVKRDL